MTRADPSSVASKLPPRLNKITSYRRTKRYIDRPEKVMLVLKEPNNAAVAITPRSIVNISSVFGISGHSIELLFSSNLIPRFQNTKYEEICLLDLSGQR